MSADTEHPIPLSKVDSAISGLSSSPPTEKKISHRRTSSSVSGVYKPEELEAEKMEITIPIETQQLNWKINKSSSQVEDPSVLKMMLCNPPVRKMDLMFPLGQVVTARNLKGVTIKDALEAIHKPYKNKADDELDMPYLKGFEWDKEECWTRFKIHLKKEAGGPAMAAATSKKAKKKEEKENAKVASVVA